MSEQQTAITGYAVRWADRYSNDLANYNFTKWHYAASENFTGCGRAIPVLARRHPALKGMDDRSRVNCKQCLARHDVQDALAEKF